MTPRRRFLAVHRWLVRLLAPAALREEYGPEMSAAFGEQLSRSASFLACLVLVIREAGHLLIVRWEIYRGEPPAVALARDLRSVRSRPTLAALVAQALMDARYGLRGMLRNPVFSVVAVVTLALGVGVNVSIFSLANEILLRPLPIPESHRLVDVLPDVPGGNSFLGFSLPDFVEYRSDNRTFSSIAATSGIMVNAGEAEQPLRGAAVTADYFDVMEVRPVVGRPFSMAEAEVPGGTLTVLISDAYWREAMGGRRDAIGSELTLSGLDFVVAGIMPAGFRGRHIGFPVDVWVPLRAMEAIRPGIDLASRDDKRLEVVGRLSPGSTLAAATADLAGIAESLRQRYPESNRGAGIRTYSFTGVDHSLRTPVKGFLGLLFLLAGMVLLIACLNVGSMLLSRASARRGELAVRSALGASRGRVTLQLLTETIVLFGVAAAAALVLATLLNSVLSRYVEVLPMSLGLDLGVDRRVVAFALLAALLSSLVAALAPSRRAAQVAPAAVLRGTAGGPSPGATRGRAALVVVQVAVAVVLLSAAGAFLQSAQRGQSFDPGIDVRRLAVTSVGIPQLLESDEERRAVMAQLMTDLESTAGVTSVALADAPPIGVDRSPVLVEVPGRDPPPDQDGFVFDRSRVSWNYGATVGLSLLRGRDFLATDEGSMDEPVIVNRAAWDTFWPGLDPVGQPVTIDGRVHTIVGVVEDTRAVIQDRSRSPRVYNLLGGRPIGRVTVVLGLADGLGGRVQRDVGDRLSSLFPQGAPTTVRSLGAVLDLAVLPQRAAFGMTGAMGGLGLLLAAVGLYGVVAFAVSRRRREFGIRMSLGAAPTGIFWKVFAGGFQLIAVGVGIGTAGVVALFPVMQRLLVGLSYADLVGAAIVLPVVIVAGLAATSVPAARALRTDPVTELKA